MEEVMEEVMGEAWATTDLFPPPPRLSMAGESRPKGTFCLLPLASILRCFSSKSTNTFKDGQHAIALSHSTILFFVCFQMTLYEKLSFS